MLLTRATLAALADEPRTERVRTIAGVEVVVRCAASQAIQADDALDAVAALHRDLAHGQALHFGWSRLTVVDDVTRFVLHEPDFAGDALAATRPDLTATLAVRAAQTWMLRRLGVPATDTTFDQQVVFLERPGLLADPLLFQRSEGGMVEQDSGWYGQDEAYHDVPNIMELATCRVYELLRLRPVLLSVMALPEGTNAIFEDERLLSLHDPEGEQRSLGLPSSPGS